MSCPFFRKTVTIKRRAAGSTSGTTGLYTAGTLSTSSIVASVQPLKGEEVQQLPEGRRSRRPFWVITDTFMNIGSSATPDFVVIDGLNFEIEQRDSWQNGVISHYRYLVLAPLEA